MSDQRGLTELGGNPGDDSPSHRPIGLVIALAAAVALVIIVIIVVVRTSDGADEPARSSQDSSSTTRDGPGSPAATLNPSTTSASAGSEAPSATISASQPSDQPKSGETRSPVPIKTPEEVKAGLTARITNVEAVKGQADGPGEVAGPAVRFTLTLRNSSPTEVPLNTTVVNLYYGKAKMPASPLAAPGGVPLPAMVSAGSEASGTYVFVVPRKARDRVLITVDYSVDVPVVAFRGSMPR